MTNPIRLIWDMHWNWRQYLKMIKWQEETIQLGDFWFQESHKQHQEKWDPEKNKILFGNHDDYRYVRQPYSLGDFGVHETKSWHKIFYIRWAYSIDKAARAHHGPKQSWREEEELTIEQWNECVKLFSEVKPDIVISHDCPEFMTHKYIWANDHFIKTRTWQILEWCWHAHKPSLWIHGHYHTRQYNFIQWCHFVCLDAYMWENKWKPYGDYMDLYIDERQYKFRWWREMYDF